MNTQNRKFKLTLLGLVMQGMGLMAHATCGTQSGTDWTITSSTGTCNPDVTATNITVNSGVAVGDSTTNFGMQFNSATQLNTLTNLGDIYGTATAVELTLNAGANITNISNGSSTNTTSRIFAVSTGLTLYSGSTINTINNYGLISGTYFRGILNNGSIGVIDNFGTISQTDSSFGLGIGAIDNGGQISSIMNNAGATISGANNSINNQSGATVTGITNDGTISSTNTSAIYNAGSIGTITNNANGVISGDFGIHNRGLITTIVNLGSIAGVTSGIYNDLNGSITTLQNAQSGLTYIGTLPTYYKIIITSSGYGTLNGTGQSSGATTFGISSLSTLRAGTFQNVLTGGFSPSAGLSNSGASTGTVTGTQGGYNWTLTYNATTTSWNLDLVQGTVTPSGPSAADTQDSLVQSVSALRSVFNYQSALVNNSLNYDCTVFSANGVCVSGGGRFAMTNNITGEQMSTLLVGSYKAKPNMRIGAFIDQNANTPNATGITVDKSPMYGVFGVWNQNTDLSGYEVRLSSSWSDQNITQTRNVVGTSEAGVGTAGLKSQALSGVVSYAMALPETSWIAAPYAGVRKTKVSRGGYTETSAVTTPLTYGDLNQDITTALAGVRMSKKYGNDLYVTASAGVEQNIGSNISTLDASGVTGLTATDFSANYAKTRPVASVGMSYAVAKDQHISFSAMYRKEAFQSAGSTTGLWMYQVGL